MSGVETLDELWDVAKKLPPPLRGQIADVSVLPESVQRYFRYAIAPGTAPASTVRLRMHGEIKLAGWHPFVAEQVICSTLGMIWQAKVSMFGLSISGSDRLIGGNGSMRWKLFGIIPLMHADGLDITRSSAGRMNIELLWLPSVLSALSVKWTSSDANCITAQFEANGEQAAPQFLMDDSGALKSVSMLRWGNPDKGTCRYVPFGAVIEESRTFGGYTIPTRLRVGWFFGTDKFESEGEFFRVMVDAVEYC